MLIIQLSMRNFTDYIKLTSNGSLDRIYEDASTIK